MTFKEKMAQAFKETFDERTENLMKIEKKHRFSLAYRLWERKMLRDFRRGRRDKHWTLQKVRCVVAAMTAAFALLIGGTAYAAIAIIGRYEFENKVNYSQMLIEAHQSDKIILEEYYGLPEKDGWVLIEYDIVTSWSTLIYQRGDIKIFFDQMIINEGNMGHISTDRAQIEPLSLFEEDDGFVLEFEDGALLYWIYDGYLFKISGNIDKSEAIYLAKSTKVVDIPKNS